MLTILSLATPAGLTKVSEPSTGSMVRANWHRFTMPGMVAGCNGGDAMSLSYYNICCRELSRQAAEKGDNVISMSVHPGAVR